MTKKQDSQDPSNETYIKLAVFITEILQFQSLCGESLNTNVCRQVVMSMNFCSLFEDTDQIQPSNSYGRLERLLNWPVLAASSKGIEVGRCSTNTLALQHSNGRQRTSKQSNPKPF
ncbi:hypothetical protein PM082_004444 [Marasmius tenuissimus]|nr:hypothetical protein PM082_004444 [Marasmius tenuissimus]